MEFIKSNPHPTGKKIGDCVVRALAIAENKKWAEVYEELCKIGLRLHEMPNSKLVYEEYLTKRGWVKQKMPRHTNGKRMKLSELADTMPKKLFIANVVKHVATIENAALLDTWNCGSKCVGNYYTKN